MSVKYVQCHIDITAISHQQFSVSRVSHFYHPVETKQSAIDVGSLFRYPKFLIILWIICRHLFALTMCVCRNGDYKTSAATVVMTAVYLPC